MKNKYQMSNIKCHISNYWKLVVLEIGSIGNSCRRQAGFTLLELLVAMGVIITVGIVVSQILTSTLRGSTKATIVSDVKQNGNYAISQMTRIIRSAKTINLFPCGNPSPATQTITITQIDTTQTTFACINNTITANGASLLDTSTVQTVPASCSFICSQSSVLTDPIIQIQFSLKQKNAGNFVNQTATASFQTSVVMRNIDTQ